MTMTDTLTPTLCRNCGKPTAPLDVAGRTIARAHCSDECFYTEFPSQRPPSDVSPLVPTLSWRQRRELDWQSMIPPRQQSYDFDQLRPMARAAVLQNAHYDGTQSILITGASEAGKTFVAYRLARMAYLSGIKVYCSTADKIRGKWLGEGGGERLIAQLKSVGLLLLDDLGMENATEGWRSVLYEIINTREEENLPSIVTVNRVKDYYSKNYSTGLANRLWRMEVVTL
jgi:DNA replication protein DnaC